MSHPPIGICPWVVSAGADGRIDQGHAFESSFLLANWGSKTLSRRTPGGRVVRGELLHLGFTFNQMPGQRISPDAPFHDAQGEFFAAGQPAGLFQGFPAYFSLDNPDENYLVIPRNNRPLFRSVTVGRMIRWQLSQFDEELKRLRAAIDGAKQRYEGYFSPTATAEDERIIGLRIERERATTPAAQARIRANREAENAEATRALRDQWDVASVPAHPYNIATRRRAEAQARLTSLPADEAQQPACLIARDERYALEPVGAVFRAAQPVAVRFSGMSGEQRDWVAIARAGAPAEQYGEWQYFDGKVSGILRFTRPLAPGRYEVRAFHPGAARPSSLKASATFEVQ